jgi:Phosphotransferase enzyme family
MTASRPRSILPAPDGFERRFGLPDPVERQGDVVVWAYPYDPVLSGLPDAAHGRAVREASVFPAPTACSVTLHKYRPRKRAVFRYIVVGRGGVCEVLYGKVLREDALRRTFEAHSALAGCGIALSPPRSFDGADGLALFSPIQGRSLRELLVEGAKLPSPRRLVELLHRVAGVRWRTPTAPRRRDRDVLAVGRLLSHLLPHRSAEIQDAAADLADLAERASAVPPGPTVHGDLYEGQIFVGERNGLGLIDLDDAGLGDPLLDAANLLSHLAVLSASTPRARRRPLAYRALLRPLVLEGLGASEADLTWRESLCMLLLATGPFRVLSPRWPDRVEARVDAALRLLSLPAARRLEGPALARASHGMACAR